MKVFGILVTFVAWMTMTEGITVDLCAYFVKGGTCHSTCQFEARHSYGIPLCSHAPENTRKCCIPLTHHTIPFRRRTSFSEVPKVSGQATRGRCLHSLLRYMKPKPTTSTTTISQAELQAAKPTSTPEPMVQDSPDSAPPTCGEPTRSARVRRVVGGRRSAPGTWPWQVALQLYTGDYMCGGVILNDKWILTAAHCFKPSQFKPQFVQVYAGSQKLHYGRDRRNFTRPITKIVQHPEFQSDVQSISTDPVTGQKLRYMRHLNDLALVELGTSLDFDDNKQPVCLPDTSDAFGETGTGKETCWVAGWGKGGHGNTSQDLQEVPGRAIDHQECSKKWGTSFTDDVICFGDKGRGPCKGDSGSGMFCRHDDGRYYVAGIVSWGRDDCAHDAHPSVLMNVAAYRNWIDSVITA